MAIEVIILSDNHGKVKVMDQIREAYPNADAYLHCGDNELRNSDMEPYHAVTGNNDYFYTYPEQLVVDVKGHRFFITHSHTLRYGKRIEDLVMLAKKNQCEFACYGHTHIFDDQIVDGIHIINPGSLYYNRDGSQPSFARLTIDDEGNTTVEKLYAEDLQ